MRRAASKACPPSLTARVPQLLEAMRSVGTGLELHSTLDRICETAAHLADARYAAIGVVDESGDGLSDFVTYGVGTEEVRLVGGRPDGLRGLLGALIQQSGPMRLGEHETGPGSDGSGGSGGSDGEGRAGPPTRTFIGVPIRVHGALFGNLYLAEKRASKDAEGSGSGAGEAGTDEDAAVAFDDQDLHVLRVLATEAGIAIGHARLYEAARQRERWIDGSVAVTTALLSNGGADALAVVAEQARSLADSAAGVVMLPTPGDGLEIVAISSDRPHPSSRLGMTAPPESPVVRSLLAA